MVQKIHRNAFKKMVIEIKIVQLSLISDLELIVGLCRLIIRWPLADAGYCNLSQTQLGCITRTVWTEL